MSTKKVSRNVMINQNLTSSRAQERRKKRRQIILFQTIGIAIAMMLISVGCVVFVYHFLPGLKVAKQMKIGNQYVETLAYQEAIESYQEVLKIDSQSVLAYRAMAGAYLNIKDQKSAEKVLYEGWQTTQNDGLLQYYCTVLLNETVEEINENHVSIQTVEKCVTVLEQDNINEDAFHLLDVSCERLLHISNEDESKISFCTSADCNSSCEFSQYLDIMKRLLAIYEKSESDEVKNILLQFGVVNLNTFTFGVAHIESYQTILEEIIAIESSSGLIQILACLEKAMWVQNVFEPAFAIFESGEFEQIKDFMNSDTYITIRDEFIAGTMEVWNGKTYIPVSREMITLSKDADSEYKFEFLDFESYKENTGVINIWGAKQEDAGVQRLAISYEPPAADESYYPHTTYEVIYLYSNVEINKTYVPKMNYRFETKTATEDGIVTELIGDWGGPNEWETDY